MVFSFNSCSEPAYATFAVPVTLPMPPADDELLEADADGDEEEELLQPAAAASPRHAMPTSAAPLAPARRDDRKNGSIPRR
jgi:hypothetical protein